MARTVPRVTERPSPTGDESHSNGPPRSGITPVVTGNGRPIVRAHSHLAHGRSPRTALVPALVHASDDAARVPESEPTARPPFLAYRGPGERSGGQILARATGGTHEIDRHGRSTVVFPEPPTRPRPRAGNGNGGLVARYTAEVPGTSWNAGADAPPASAFETSTQVVDAFDELYDRVLTRLRRDLIVERERRGDLAGAFFR